MKKVLLKYLYILFFNLFIMEICLRLIYTFAPISPELAYHLDPIGSIIHKRLWCKTHNSNLSNGSVMINYDNYDNQTGWKNKKNLRNYRQHNGTHLNTNKDGDRITKYRYEHERKLAIEKIAIIGDSYAFGEEVDDNQSIPFLLQRKSTNRSILNWAVPGFGHDQMLLHLKNKLKKTKIKKLILLFMEMDMERNLMWFRDYARPLYSIKDGQLYLENSLIDPPQKTLKESIYEPRILDPLRLGFNFFSHKYSPDYKIELTYKIIEKMSTICRERNIDFFIIICPALPLDHEAKKVSLEEYNSLISDNREVIKLVNKFKEINIKTIDIRNDVYKLYFKGVNFYTDNNSEHWSPLANKNIADIIWSTKRIE